MEEQKLFRTKRGSETVEYGELRHGQCVWVDGPKGREIRLRCKLDGIDMLADEERFRAIRRASARRRAEEHEREYQRSKKLRAGKYLDRYSMHALY